MSTVNLGGQPIEVAGTFPGVGQQPPDFVLTTRDLQDVTLDTYAGQRKLLNIVPSLDTPTCAISTRKFNQQAAALENTVVLVISADLPFAMARFCAAEGLERVVSLSTFRSHAFHGDYGVDITTGVLRGLTARAVVVLAADNRVLHAELVSDIKSEPNYELALAALNR